MMSSEMASEILNGNNGVILTCLLVLWRFHNQGMGKLDVIANNITSMDKNVEKHTVELEFGTKEMMRQDEHNKSQDIQIGKNRDDIQRIKGKYIT